MRIILAPEWAQAPLLKFGLTKYGKPKFRVVWGPSVTKIAVGGFGREARYILLRKYGGDTKWILEKWMPCNETPEQWEERTATPDQFFGMGPYPSHGTYECCEKFSVCPGVEGFVPLEPGLVEMTARAVVMGRTRTPGEIKQGIEKELAAEDKERDTKFDDIWDDRQHKYKGGLTIGAHTKYNHEEEVQDYVRRLVNSRALTFNKGREFRPGFHQGA